MMNLLTLEEAAAILRRSPAQMRWLRHQGTGPLSAKIAGRVMYRAEDIEKYVTAQFDAEGMKATA
ncbi:helix-turn-helix domain-containing protein [Cryobacterium sp. CG_9.6]|uniref:helix-turn-helix domain-containing protein n=1 Tax=Cryobacterium sp. CG_9.6 TaxID=2760710 RepID=UPI002474C897|nr:helix-turn-helix domain-containing protein [Cryobacterium sp. CG_9.6]MDH6237042.1 hypothetical protein [Cryobacterium sp. CG_9.6]